MTTPVLECRDVTVRFGSFTAVSDLSYSFESGHVYGIIGPNGAGKTTLMNAIVGGLRPSTGSVHLFGSDVTGLGIPARARLGLGRSFQISKIFGAMTVFENLRLAAQVNRFKRQPAWIPAAWDKAIAADATAMLEEIGLSQHRDTPAERLSHGDQRALELGLTLMPQPKLLLLDEPLAGVGHQSLHQAVALLERVIRGRTVLLIEHNMDVVMRLARTVLVMAGGKLLASGTPDEVRKDERVRAAYLGSAAAA
jgi:branched-chain amino acid transport system ATP-binding protein